MLAAWRVDRLNDTAETVVETAREALLIAIDIADPDRAHRMVDATMNRFGRLDVRINNTGVGTARPAARETPEEFREVIDINLTGSHSAAQACGRVIPPGTELPATAVWLASNAAGYVTGQTIVVDGGVTLT